VVWGEGEEVAYFGQSAGSGGLVSSMAFNPTPWVSPKPAWAARAKIRVKHLLQGREEGGV